MRCQEMVVKTVYLGRVDQCQRKGRFKTNLGFFCKQHLMKKRTFSQNPVDTKTGKELDREVLYRTGRLEERNFTPIMEQK